jgi:DNA mismatch repair ATPase MutS
VNFIADRQTLEDLNMLGKHRQGSVYSIFNKVKTRGGERLLEQWFQNPLNDPAEINKRSALFSAFSGSGIEFSFDPASLVKAEGFLDNRPPGQYPVAVADLAIKKLKGAFLHDDQFKQMIEGLSATVRFLRDCKNLLQKLQRVRTDVVNGHFKNERENLAAAMADKRLSWLESVHEVENYTFMQLSKYSYLLRHVLIAEMKAILEIVYRLDVYISVAELAGARNFGFGEALPAADNRFETSGLWHPALLNGVANRLDFGADSNMLFLTGANMAGKSTLMKSFGIVVYLAHMGFPVPAKGLRFSVMEGLYSSINVSDNLNSGYSHFYAEVLRVKTVAEQVSKGRRLIVLFDELFKGTNVKDAFEATLAVTRAFSDFSKCFFIISTHIVEVGEQLLADAARTQAAYLPTIMEGQKPRYTYTLEAGISSDRQGMLIIQNEGILKMLAEDG